jgi:hypothetical protein
MSPFVARLRHAGGRRECPELGEDRKHSAGAQNGAFDLSPTSGLIAYKSAITGLFDHLIRTGKERGWNGEA